MGREQNIPYFITTGFFAPADAPKNQRDAVSLQEPLDRLVERRVGKKGDPGELFRTFQHGPGLFAIAIFDITDGQQVGLGVVMKIPLFKKPEFTTGITLASTYRGRGYGFLAWKYLSLLNASTIRNGANFTEVNTASPENSPAVERLMQRAGARRDTRTPAIWYVHVPNPNREIPLTVDARSLAFRLRGKVAESLQGMTRRGDRLLFEDTPIGEIKKNEVVIIQTSEPDMRFWNGVDALWQSAKRAGLHPNLRI